MVSPQGLDYCTCMVRQWPQKAHPQYSSMFLLYTGLGRKCIVFFKNLVGHIMIWLYDVTCGFFFLGWGPEM